MENNKMCAPPRTRDGETWLKAYIHPPTGLDGVQGIPDQSVQSSTTLNFRNEFSIDPPTGTGTGTWSALILSLPNPQYPLLVMKWQGDLPSAIGGVVFQWYLNPNFDFGTNVTNWQTNVAKYRFFADSTTTYFNAASLYDQGKAYVAQTAVADENLSTASGNPVSNRYNLNTVPAAASQLIQVSDRYYTGMARDGSFSVEGFLNPAMQYQSGQGAPFTVAGLFPLSNGTNAFFNQTPVAVGASVVPTYAGFTSSYHLYKGLLAQATLNVKRVMGLEILPNPGSAWAPFSTPGPAPDQAALEAAACARHSMRDAVPSAANDLGSFLSLGKGLLSVVPHMWKAAKPFAKSALGQLPGGGIANQIIDALEGIGNLSSGEAGPKNQKAKVKAAVAKAVKKQVAPPAQKLSKNQAKKLKKSYARMEELD